MHHARVCILADRYCIAPLVEMSLMKLDGALDGYAISESGLNHVVELVRICHAELVPERLRLLVVDCAAANVENLWESEGFQGLLEDYATLSSTMIKAMLPRLE